MRKIMEGLAILLKYAPDGDCCAQHDVIYAAPDSKDKVSEEDQAKLKDLGWTWNERESCWQKFT